MALVSLRFHACFAPFRNVFGLLLEVFFGLSQVMGDKEKPLT